MEILNKKGDNLNHRPYFIIGYIFRMYQSEIFKIYLYTIHLVKVILL